MWRALTLRRRASLNALVLGSNIQKHLGAKSLHLWLPGAALQTEKDVPANPPVKNQTHATFAFIESENNIFA